MDWHISNVFFFFQIDVNDNYPIIADFEIIFNQRIDEYFSQPIGYVPAKDADPTSKLQYNFTYGNTGNLLQLDASTGAIRLSPTLKSNVNVEARVGVSVSDGKNEARANLRLRLNHVTDTMLEQAVTLSIANVTARQFLSPFYDYLVEALSVVIPCQKNQIYVFRWALKALWATINCHNDELSSSLTWDCIQLSFLIKCY